MVSYTYDAWGKPISKTGTLANTLGKLNPFRYRSYAYDEETGLYYLQSRYYSPLTTCIYKTELVIEETQYEAIQNIQVQPFPPN
jgi:RHS repeat-associated protein